MVVGAHAERDGNENVGGRVSGGGGNLFRVINVDGGDGCIHDCGSDGDAVNESGADDVISADDDGDIGQGPNGQGAMLMVFVVVTVLL